MLEVPHVQERLNLARNLGQVLAKRTRRYEVNFARSVQQDVTKTGNGE